MINKDKTKTNIWVTFLRIIGKSRHSVERKCFVKYNESFTVKNLKEGAYNIQVVHGTKWRQPLNNISCSGRFSENESVTSWACSKIYNIEKYSQHTYTSLNEPSSTYYDEKQQVMRCK
ncbi:hypothetical protein [Aquimarina agarivorans]|uniref:hypothetical protein n=1 Tax=Aquimarina agarivorans TaxID=980584 RepID=UPI000248F5DB|nr:hypothetical protein [Aquimarina agarivorans]